MKTFLRKKWVADLSAVLLILFGCYAIFYNNTFAGIIFVILAVVGLSILADKYLGSKEPEAKNRKGLSK